MREGEPSWLAAFGRPAAALRSGGRPRLSLPSARSDYALQVHLGERPAGPRSPSAKRPR